MPHEEDFAPDADGLREALRWLIEARSQPGSPHVDPAVPLDIGQQWPEVGLGRGRGPVLSSVRRAQSRSSRPDVMIATRARPPGRCRAPRGWPQGVR